MTTQPTLARRLGLGDAVWIGLGSMVGAGVFSAFAPAARAAGSGLLIALAIAAAVAFANATSSAQLAARYPAAGGTYVYGRAELGEWWGFLAGWGFVVGKSASCAAMALTFAAYATGGGAWERPVATLTVIALGLTNLRGITRTAGLAKVIVVAVVALLLIAVVLPPVVAGFPRPAVAPVPFLPHGPYGLLQGAGLLFFAFAGYARIATMGEEVVEPERTIPRAVPVALALAVAVYAMVGTILLAVATPDSIGATTTPLALPALTSGMAWAVPLVRIGAALASLGALLSLIAGVGRTTLAMAREGDLPRWLAVVDDRHHVPHHAELALMGVVVALVWVADLRGAIGFSSLGVLLYYAVANASAFHQVDGRRWPRALQVFGLLGCLVLVMTLPWQAIAVGVGVFAVGAAGRVLSTRFARSRSGG